MADAPDPSPTETELTAMLDPTLPRHFTVKQLVESLRSARESARVATRERDNLQSALLRTTPEAINECERKLTDRDRMIAGLRGLTLADLQATPTRAWKVIQDALAAAPPGGYEQRVRREALEEAARVATTYSEQWETDNISATIAAAIRALQDRPPT